MITATDKTTEKIKSLLEQEEDGETLSLRVAVKAGGCSGYSYEMYFDKKIKETDIVLEQGGVKIISDIQSAELLKEAVLEYKDGLEAGFSIENSGAERTCGCGKSFC